MTVLGIDISHYQGTPDFVAVKAAGFGFVIMKATEATSYTDPVFRANHDNARAAGLSIGYYHFARNLDPIAEADYFCNAVGHLLPGDLVALDWEVPGTNPPGYALAWLQRVESVLGVKPLVYMNLSTERGSDWSPVANANYGLWLAHYDFDPNNAPVAVPYWSTVAIEQYSDRGVVAGVAGGVDCDVFYGDAAALAKYGYQGQAPAPAPQPLPEPPPAVGFPLPPGQYFGLITGPAISHGGATAQERVWVKQIQVKLQELGYAPNVPGWADGVYQQPTVDAVAAWQRANMPGTQFFGQVWSDDWAVLIQGAPAPKPVINAGPFPLPHNQYFGLVSGPAASHGGYYGWEQVHIKHIQQKLIELGYVPGIGDINSRWADGVFQQPTANAVAEFQRAHMPGTTRFGEVWFDDWAKLFSL